MAAEEQLPYPPELPPGISLEELAAAFAHAMGQGAQPSGGQPGAGDKGVASAAEDSTHAQAAAAFLFGPGEDSGSTRQAAHSAPADVLSSQAADSGDSAGTAAAARRAGAVRAGLGPADLNGVSGSESAASGEEIADGTDGPCPITPASVLEAMLFVGNRDGSPLAPARAAELMRGVSAGEIAGLVDELNAYYEADGRPYTIVSEGSGYRLKLRPEFAPLRDRFYGKLREARLSQAAVDILAIVAYQQPLSAEQINKLRGKPSGHVLSQLVHRQLLRIERAGPRRTAQYYTTERFLRLFGLESLDDLPRD